MSTSSARVAFKALSVGALFRDKAGRPWRKIERLSWRTVDGHRCHANAVSADPGCTWLREWSPNAKVVVEP